MDSLDAHGQPLATFNRTRNRDKALFSLLGICKGLTADRALSAQEVIFLDAWLRNFNGLTNDPDVIDILDVLTDILKDGVVTLDEREDLLNLLDCVLRHREKPGGKADEINRLLAILRGIAGDRKINDREILYLNDWISSQECLRDTFPGNAVLERIETILADGVVTEPERLDLLEMLGQITGDQYEETGLAYGAATEFCAQEVDRLTWQEKTFCFTGKFITGTRKCVEAHAAQLGALITSSVTKNVDYVVIGTLASRDWRFTSHGRKIEAALKLQRGGHPIVILTERHWRDHL